MHDFDRFVGLPWQDRGRSLAGSDCWGLFRLVFASTGIVLPSLDESYTSASDKVEISDLIESRGSDWVDVARGAERRFDAVLMMIAGGYHIGVAAGRGIMLHMPRGKTSVIEPLSRYDRVLVGLYRHRQLAGR